MEKQINTWIIMEMGQFMDESQQKLALSDETYQNDCKDAKELEKQYEALNLTKRQKMLVNDYISCTKSADCRYSELSYIAGVKDTIKILMYLGLLNNTVISVSKKINFMLIMPAKIC